MGKELRIICDCCKREIEPDDYYLKVAPNYLWQGKGNFRKEETETFEWYICKDCLSTIGRRVAEQHNVDFEVTE